MTTTSYRYIIVGAGLAGASAVTGIRKVDADGSILLIGSEPERPYDRPPLSKQLWSGKKSVEQIFLRNEAFFAENGVELRLDAKVTGLDPKGKNIADDRQRTCHYEKLLLATGAHPRTLPIPGSRLERVYSYRTLADFHALRARVTAGAAAVIIGGGFIGAEMAAALRLTGLSVTMIFPEPYLASRIFPAELGRAMLDYYRAQGITILAEDVPTAFTEHGDGLTVTTRGGQQLHADFAVVGVGVTPALELAAAAGLAVGNGVLVNAELQTSVPDIYAAGDIANYPDPVLGERRRVEHRDNALQQGKLAGRNMAGAGEPYTYLPFFYSDLFDFGYEAVGEVNTQLETFADWQQENRTGVIYYLKDGHVRGAMMCNVWDKLDAARALITRTAPITVEELRGAIALS